MLLETRTVSAKTPRDGKLEITPDTAARLTALGESFPLRVHGRASTARLARLECTCGKRAGGLHVHHFVESPLLASLAAGTDVDLVLDAAGGEAGVDVATHMRGGER